MEDNDDDDAADDDNDDDANDGSWSFSFPNDQIQYTTSIHFLSCLLSR